MIERPILRGKVNFPLCMAPMVGLSHVYLRSIVRRYLPADAYTIWPTEMLNSRKIPHQTLGETPETRRNPSEVGLVPQILGNDEESLSQSARKLEAWGAEGIDVNMGCPVKKALRHNYGVALMGDMKYAASVVGMTKRHATVPVSVKLRSGLQHDRVYLKDFVEGLQDQGAEWITLHPRSAGERRRGEAQWDEIAFARDQLKIAVIGNGDIQVVEDVFRMRTETSCDSVMVGRAITARPWILWQAGEEWGYKTPLGREGESAPRGPESEGQEYGRMLLDMVEAFQETKSPDLALRQLRFFVTTGSVWLEFGLTLQALVSRAKSLEEAKSHIADFFKVKQNMAARTTLRN